jgi:Flp pilus assembly protein TadD
LVVILLAACSRKKNTFLSRNAHAVKAEFNALYNGNLAFEDGMEELSMTYRDNFWEILPVERIDLEEDMMMPGADGNPLFNRAEEKAAKAIQTHSIYIDGKEYNPQIDEAYILLGKARYFDRRFIPALDAFNFILDKYPTSNNINHAKVWRAKTNIRLNNEEVALESLTRMLKNANLSDEDYTDANAIMAQAYISLDSSDAALPYIKEASLTVKDKELKGRYTFIKGQLYDRLGHKDSANMAYDEVIEMNRKSPRVYMINAYIAKAKNFDYEGGDRTAFLDLLFDLESNRENRPFLDKIYNQIGEYYRNTDSIETAIEYYNKSIEYFQNDNILQAVNYQTLAEINFDRAEYRNAGLYYDSTLTHLVEGSRQWRRVKKKRENLADVIKYEDIAATNDSILRIVGMTETQRLAYFTEYTTRIKEKAIADSIASVKEQEAIANNEFYKKTRRESNNEEGATFYFYNSSTVSFGKQEFKSVWGKRKLEDDWRRSNKVSKLEIEEDESAEETPITENELYDPEFYIARVPTDQKEIDSLFRDRNFAYYQLGLIYKEKFREYGLAADRLTSLLSFEPEERLILPSKYNLHKIYLQLENDERAQFYKDDIINNYPNSRYAEILLNPNTMLATDESSPEFKYKELFKEFEASEYQFVIDQCESYIAAYFGDDVVPKFELLKATAIARQQGFEPYKKALNFVALNYPNSDEGKQAQKIYSTVLPKIANKNFYADEQSDEWKLIYDFKKEDREDAEKLKEKLDEAIDFFNYTDMLTSIDYYNPELVFVVVHGLNTRLGGRGFGKVLEEHKKFKIKKSFFEINSPNYKIIQIHKNLEEYLTADLSIPLVEKKSSGGKTDTKKEEVKEGTNAKNSINERKRSKKEIINEMKEKALKNKNEKEKGAEKGSMNQKSKGTP